MSREKDMMSAIADLLCDYPVADVLSAMSDAVDVVGERSGDWRFAEASSRMKFAGEMLRAAERSSELDVAHGAETLAEALAERAS